MTNVHFENSIALFQIFNQYFFKINLGLYIIGSRDGKIGLDDKGRRGRKRKGGISRRGKWRRGMACRLGRKRVMRRKFITCFWQMHSDRCHVPCPFPSSFFSSHPWFSSWKVFSPPPACVHFRNSEKNLLESSSSRLLRE